MKPETPLQNQLKAIRTRLGLSQQALADAAGIARQTIGGIEAGLYAPSAAVALRLAKALGCPVEEIFWLDEEPRIVEAILADPLRAPAQETLRLTLAQVEGRWVAHTLAEESAFRAEMLPADGIGVWEPGRPTVAARLLDEPEALARTALLAGCAPALSLWARSAERWHPGLRVHWLHANSMAALHRLRRGEVHAAGIHLYDPAAGADNESFVRRLFPGEPMALAHLGIWEEGLVVAAGNPKRLYRAADLAQPGVRLINREEGAGARLLLDSRLQQAGVPAAEVAGYENRVSSHLEIAQAVRDGRADAGISAASIAAAFGLGFVPWQAARYDLALRAGALEYEPAQQLLDTLRHRRVRAQLQVTGGYDTVLTGEIVRL
jgi:molybdate-binding protein/DNA-binding XRE family transcriptional regulator